MPRSTLEKYLTEFLAIEGVSVEEATQFALAKERNHLLRDAELAEPPVAAMLRRVAHALSPLIVEYRRKMVDSPEARLLTRTSSKHDREALFPSLKHLIGEGARLAEAARKLGVPYGTAYQWVNSEAKSQAEVSPTTIDASPPPNDGSETSPHES